MRTTLERQLEREKQLEKQKDYLEDEEDDFNDETFTLKPPRARFEIINVFDNTNSN